ncbi:MAG: LysR family transcriptional regulator [Burkholderiales bacterium]|nr:LysR family transcriptional regulator [Burkholderiales bacterium]
MDYRQLEVFRAVLDTGSASAAARLLGLSQPAVSRQLAQLEAALDIDLFARERGRLLPTAHAVELYREVAHAFEGVERVLNAVRRMRANNTGTLRIAAPYSFCEVLLPRIVARLAAAHPDLRYAVELGSYEAIAAMLAKHEVDVGILKEPMEHAGISTLPLVDSVVACALPSAHRLARGASVRAQDLAREPLVMLGRNAAWLQEVRALLNRAGKAPTVRLETHAVGAACGFAANGLGIALVPELLGAQYISRDLVLRPLSVRIDQRFAVGFPKGLQRAGLVGKFTEAAVKVARELLREARRAT